ncbi:8380_t:CDS:1 [Scutellospora calospora]|uniref:8380_t:CDS:1 n=1 Tax=Scutellospora calospora TaxID=85575 RepID=A0ACA9M1U2_9GLOM|nr:8380_t:CDS:1 [Scutellospora calospora]
MSKCPEDCKYLCCRQIIVDKRLTCNLGNCKNDKDLQRSKKCGFQHDGFTYSYHNNFDIKFKNQDGIRIPYNEPLSERFLYFPLFRFNDNELNQFDQKTPEFILLDIAFDIILVSFHGSNKHNQLRQTLQLTSSTEYSNDFIPMMQNMFFSIYLINICDKRLAKQKEYKAEDFLIGNNFENIQFREGIEILDEIYRYIPCGLDCTFHDHNISLCYEFRKNLKVCVLNKNINGEDYYFNIGKFGIVMIVNYMDWMHQIRIQHPNVEDKDKHELDENFQISEGGTGWSVFIKEFYLESFYKPVIKPLTISNFMS